VHRPGATEAAVHAGGGEGDPGGDGAGEDGDVGGEGGVPLLPGGGERQVRWDGKVARHGHGQPAAHGRGHLLLRLGQQVEVPGTALEICFSMYIYIGCSISVRGFFQLLGVFGTSVHGG
jgi:hypothetical protein